MNDAQKAALIANARRARRKITITNLSLHPEGDEPFECWIMPISVADLAKYGSALYDGSPDVFVKMLVDKAETEQGERVFEDGDMEWFAPIVNNAAILEITTAISGDEEEVAKALADASGDVEGNSDGTPSSS